jgi:hypothetical protein
MLGLILLLIVSAGLQLNASNLDDTFTSFLSSPYTSESHPYHSFAVKNLYELYKNKFSRSSMTSSEENDRYTSFHNNVLNLVKHHKQGDKPYTVGLNKYADWTDDELQNLRGLRRPHGRITRRNFKHHQRLSTLNERGIQSPTTVLPSSFDYTTRVVSGTNTPIVSIILLFLFKLINLFYLS